MAAGVKLGSFTDPGSPQSQSVTGVGFKPAAVLVMVGNPAGSTASAVGGFGAAVSSSRMFGGGFGSQDAQGAATTRVSFESDRFFSQPNSITEALVAVGEYTSSDNDGFTHNWSTAGTGFGFNYIAFARTTQMGVGTFDTATATGDQTISGITDQDGNAFTPKLIIFYTSIVDTTEDFRSITARHMIGAATSSTNEMCYFGIDTDAADPTDCSTYLSATKCLVFTSTAAVTASADFVSFGNGTATVNWAVAPGAAIRIGYVAWGGASFSAHVGTYTARTTVGTKTETGVPFQPNFLMAGIGSPGASLDTIGVFMTSGIGATDGTTQFAVCTNSQDNVATSNTDRGGSGTAITLVTPASAATAVLVAAWTAWTSDGFTLNYTTVTGTAAQFGYIAMSVPDAPLLVSPKMHEYRRRRTA